MRTTVPVFTLTVPASFVGQILRLCLQPARAGAKTLCHSIRIDLGATISVPVASNVVASVVKAKASKKAKSAKTVSKASKALAALTSTGKSARKGAKR